VYQWARKHGVKTAWGTDLLFEPELAGKQSKIVTSGNAGLFRLSGERDPYKAARLGEITAGAWADVLLIDGDPTADLTLLSAPEKNIAVIVKDGTIVKNTL
jgi:imidazolonepropionase-like amidohydrolase